MTNEEGGGTHVRQRFASTEGIHSTTHSKTTGHRFAYLGLLRVALQSLRRLLGGGDARFQGALGLVCALTRVCEKNLPGKGDNETDGER